MKMWEALSMLAAARDGIIPTKRQAVKLYGDRSKQTLREIGMTVIEMDNEYPKEELDHGLFLMTNHPTEFAKQARASAAWLISQN